MAQEGQESRGRGAGGGAPERADVLAAPVMNRPDTRPRLCCGLVIRPPETLPGATGGLVGPAWEEFLPFLPGEAAAGDGAGPLAPGGGIHVPQQDGAILEGSGQCVPSRIKAASVGLEGPVSGTPICFPEPTSQSTAVPSLPEVASTLPSRLKLTLSTGPPPAAPAGRRAAPVRGSHSRTLPSTVAAARVLPSRENASALVP